MPVPQITLKPQGSPNTPTSSPVNALNWQVDSISSALGAQPEGSYNSVSDRLSALEMLPGYVWYVNSATGSDSGTGTKASPFLTIAHAVAVASAGDIIAIQGSFNEAVTCSLAGVQFRGIGSGPVMATWTAPTVAASFCLKLAAANCFVDNIKFKPVIYTTSGIPSAIRLSTSFDYSKITRCRFQGQANSYTAIYADSNGSNVQIEDNEFLYMNTLTNGCAISASLAGAWRIRRNMFNSNYEDIKIIGRFCEITDNIFPTVGLKADNTLGTVTGGAAVDLSGTNSGCNTVTRNTLGGTYNLATYTPGATGDMWRGNYAAITVTTAPNGLTVLPPAA